MPKAAVAKTTRAAPVDKAPKKTKKETKKDPNAPKRPPSAYLLFCADEREQKTDIKGPEMMKHLGKAWKAIDEKDKQAYEKKAATLKADYEKVMLKYKADHKADPEEKENVAGSESE
ncbi:hypothetical protein HK101_003867 [Irineochytrium annulatum]|nr:hypothetical protein HK101_003867 [Irineochytrium annulatum]